MDFNLDHATAVLQRTPVTLDRLLRGLSPDWTSPNEGPDTWSAFDVVGHLIDGEETDWIPRARIILNQGPERRFEPFDRFRHVALNRGKRLETLLERFGALRHDNLTTLREFHLTPKQLDLQGEHPALGAVTLAQLLATWVAHDLGHLAQIARVMARQYAGAVGPWAEYLPVLQRRSGAG